MNRHRKRAPAPARLLGPFAALALLAAISPDRVQAQPAAPQAEGPRIHGVSTIWPPPELRGPFPAVAPPAKLGDVVMTGEAAKQAFGLALMRYDVAERIGKAAFACAARNGQGVAVYILDPFGVVIYAGRMDGKLPANSETALLKAKTALFLRDSTHRVANQSVNELVSELRAMQLDLFPVGGGLPIIVGGQLLGAIGAGGSRYDEECIWEGLQTVLGPQPPLAEALPPHPR